MDVFQNRNFKIYCSPITGKLRDNYDIAKNFVFYFLHTKVGTILKEEEIISFLNPYNSYDNNPKLNYEANIFARGLLVPTEEFKAKKILFNNDIFELADYFNVSTEIINKRITDNEAE